MLHQKVWWPKHPEFGIGEIVVINPYKEYGLPSHQIEHYKVYFPIKMVFVTIFKKDLIFTKE